MFGGYLLVMIVGILISGAAALWVRSSYSKYSKKMSASGLTGAQTARMILDRNNLSNVKVEPVAGQFTDHYDPRAKVVRLSEGNFRGNSIAGVSVAAHECGHAIQDATGYLTVSEVFPMEVRAMAIALFYSIATALGGISGPVVFGQLIGTGNAGKLFVGYLVGAGLMILAAIVELLLGVRAEGKSLEDVAMPLTAIEEATGARLRGGPSYRGA